MITTSDIAQVIHKDCRGFGIPLYISGNIPVGDVDDERIVIIPKTIEDGTRWYRCFAEVNWLVPDIKGEADRRRLGVVERLLKPLFYRQGVIDGTQYRYRKYSTGIEQERGLDCHYVNLRLLIEIQKVIEK